MTRKLRDYQIEACQAIRDAWADGMLRPGVVLPTGCGKTDVIAEPAIRAARENKRVLVLAHRGELLDQITERCGMHDPSIPVGRVQAGRNQTRRPITVAMAPTLASEKRRARLPRPDLVIVDEAHHAASPSYMSILRWAGSFDHTPTLGVTATMVRGDRRGLGDVWQQVVFSRDIRWAIGKGWLVEPRGKAVVTDHMDLNAAKVSRGDYQDSELGEMVAQDVDQIVKAWHTHAADRQTVAFTPNVASAQQLAEEFRSVGVPVGEVYGFTPATDRARIYADLAAGHIRVLVSVMVTTEGWDCPPVSCILQARPTRLPGLYQQMVGRGLRPSPGKTDCLVLDVVGASRGQKLVTLIDLHETAQYDTSELDELPCDDCGEFPCVCPAEERGPALGPARLMGPAEYEDIDMFTGSSLNWLFTRGGSRFLPVGEDVVTLWQDPDTGLYQAGFMNMKTRKGAGDPAGLISLDEARKHAEDWALEVDPSLASRGASWRKRGGPPSEAQVAYATRLGVHEPAAMNKARLSDEISIALASRVIDR